MPRIRPPSKEESQLLAAYAELPEHAIYIPVTDAEFAAARTALMQQNALGFDTESKPLFHVGQTDTGPHLVQLSTPHAAWLLQLHRPQAVQLAQDIVSHPHICKVGFGLDNDKTSLPQRLGVPLVNVVDLDSTFKAHGYGASTGVRAAVALVLQQNFQKSKKQSTSNWATEKLSAAQVRYAANDAHAPAMVFAALQAWEAQQPPLQKKTAPRVRQASPMVEDTDSTDASSRVNDILPLQDAQGALRTHPAHTITERTSRSNASAASRPYNPKVAALLQAPRA